MKKPHREIRIFGDSYWEFYQTLSKEGQEKVDVVLELLRTSEVLASEYEPMPTLIPGIHEVRVDHEDQYYRIFLTFGDENELIILNGTQYNFDD